MLAVTFDLVESRFLRVVAPKFSAITNTGIVTARSLSPSRNGNPTSPGVVSSTATAPAS